MAEITYANSDDFRVVYLHNSMRPVALADDQFVGVVNGVLAVVDSVDKALGTLNKDEAPRGVTVTEDRQIMLAWHPEDGENDRLIQQVAIVQKNGKLKAVTKAEQMTNIVGRRYDRYQRRMAKAQEELAQAS